MDGDIDAAVKAVLGDDIVDGSSVWSALALIWGVVLVAGSLRHHGAEPAEVSPTPLRIGPLKTINHTSGPFFQYQNETQRCVYVSP